MIRSYGEVHHLGASLLSGTPWPLQEVQDTHAWLKRTYAALDEQAAQTAHESLDRYLRNTALLGQIFSGPGCSPEPLCEWPEQALPLPLCSTPLCSLKQGVASHPGWCLVTGAACSGSKLVG